MQGWQQSQTTGDISVASKYDQRGMFLTKRREESLEEVAMKGQQKNFVREDSQHGVLFNVVMPVGKVKLPCKPPLPL